MMKAAIRWQAECFAATQHLRHCNAANADNAESDYRALFENLQKMSSPQQAMSMIHEHMQNRFLHTVKWFNDVRVAMTENQHAMAHRLQYEAPAEVKNKPKQETYNESFFMDTMNSAFNQMAGMTQDLVLSEVEREAEVAASFKAAASKNNKSQAKHHTNKKD